MSSRLDGLIRKLRKRYGEVPSPPSDAFVLFVWEILSNHSTPKKRDAALEALKRHRVLTPDAMWHASAATLEASVGLAGPYREQRLLALRKGVDAFRGNPALPSIVKGPVPAAVKALTQLPKMTGDSGAYRMLLFAGDHALLPVDAKVARVATRIGYGEKVADFSKTARSVRQAASVELSESLDAYRTAYLYLEHHGGAMCTETNPQCDDCPLFADCRYAKNR
jgi:A/G-specific adenine glycosylase